MTLSIFEIIDSERYTYLNAKKDLVSENPSAVNMSNLFLKLIFRSYDYAISFTDICIKKYLHMLYASYMMSFH